jgi:hypothetical protein
LEQFHGAVVEKNVADVKIENSNKTSGHVSVRDNAVVRSFAPIVRGAVAEPSFAERHPILSQIFSCFVAFVTLPVLIIANVVVTPFLMGAAFFSKTCGSGELARDIGKTWLAKTLWGDFADKVAGGTLGSGWMALIAFVPVLGPAWGVAPLGGLEMNDRTLGLLANGAPVGDLRIQADIDKSINLGESVQLWIGTLPQDQHAEIDAEKWAAWANDPTQDAWTKPLSALLQKLHEGAPRNQGKFPVEFASRMKAVLKTIQSDPQPFIPFISSLGLSGMGTCKDRPVTSFLDLELRTEARHVLAEIKNGRKTAQDMLDIATKRLVFEESFQALASATATGNLDPISAMLNAWAVLSRSDGLKIPRLPYRLYGTDLTNEQVNEIAKTAAEVVRGRMSDAGCIAEFLGRGDDSPVPWSEVKPPLSNGTLKKMDALKRREDSLEPPDDFESREYLKYLADLKAIQGERKLLESGNVWYDDAKKQWRIAEQIAYVPRTSASSKNVRTNLPNILLDNSIDKLSVGAEQVPPVQTLSNSLSSTDQDVTQVLDLETINGLTFGPNENGI